MQRNVQVEAKAGSRGGPEYGGLSTAATQGVASGRDDRRSCRETRGARVRSRSAHRACRTFGAEAQAKTLTRVWATAQEALPEEELQFYRRYTEALLRRYGRLRLQAGRVPSRMDSELFRGKMSHYKVEGFEDRVIFCADVERCLGRLNAEDGQLLRRIAIQEYSMGEAAGMLGKSLRSAVMLYHRALDRMTRLFFQSRLLTPAGACQETERTGNQLSA